MASTELIKEMMTYEKKKNFKKFNILPRNNVFFVEK